MVHSWPSAQSWWDICHPGRVYISVLRAPGEQLWLWEVKMILILNMLLIGIPRGNVRRRLGTRSGLEFYGCDDPRMHLCGGWRPELSERMRSLSPSLWEGMEGSSPGQSSAHPPLFPHLYHTVHVSLTTSKHFPKTREGIVYFESSTVFSAGLETEDFKVRGHQTSR